MWDFIVFKKIQVRFCVYNNFYIFLLFLCLFIFFKKQCKQLDVIEALGNVLFLCFYSLIYT